MHVHIALVPPESVLTSAADVLRGADPPPEVQDPRAARSLFGRHRKEPGPRSPQLEHLEPARMLIPIASFGNVTPADALRLGAVLREAAASVPPPTLYLSGGAALEFPGDQSVWLKLQGDLEGLRQIPPTMTRTVEPLGFFVDRRGFRPMLAVAHVTDATTEEGLQHVLDQLDAFRSDEWTVGHASLMKRVLGEQLPRSEEIERIPLGGAAS